MTDKKTSDDFFKEFLASADPVVREQFPEYETVLKVAKTLTKINFRTRYNCFVDDAEHPDPVSVVEPGRAESLDHLVQRLTGKQNPTMRDLSYLVIKGGSDGFEDPTNMSEEEIDDRMERVVALGDKLDGVEAYQQAITEGQAVSEQDDLSAKRVTKERATSEAVRSEPKKTAQIGAEESA